MLDHSNFEIGTDSVGEGDEPCGSLNSKSSGKKVKKLGLSTEKIRSVEILKNLFLMVNNMEDVDFVDCAWRYGNEPFIGIALKQLKQKDNKFDLVLPFQSKVWPTKFNGGINKSLKFSLQKIGAFDCIDTYFLHCPSQSWATNLLAYKQLIECMNNGYTRKIGLGSFSVDLLERLAQFTHKYPHVLQHNMSVNNLDIDLLNYCQNHNIELQAYEPLGELRSNSRNPILQAMSVKYNCSIQNLLIAYLLELGVVPVVAYDKLDDIKQLSNVKKIQISQGDMEILKTLNKFKSKKVKSNR